MATPNLEDKSKKGFFQKIKEKFQDYLKFDDVVSKDNRVIGADFSRRRYDRVKSALLYRNKL